MPMARPESPALPPSSDFRIRIPGISLGLIEVACVAGCLQQAELEMKTILLPTQNTAEMKSAAETAVLLARRTGAYLQGFPLRVAVPPFVVAELTVGFTVDEFTK